MTFEMMDHMQRFVESLTTEQRLTFKLRTGLRDGRPRSQVDTAFDRAVTVATVRTSERQTAEKFDKFVLKPYLELQRKGNDD